MMAIQDASRPDRLTDNAGRCSVRFSQQMKAPRPGER